MEISFTNYSGPRGTPTVESVGISFMYATIEMDLKIIGCLLSTFPTHLYMQVKYL